MKSAGLRYILIYSIKMHLHGRPKEITQFQFGHFLPFASSLKSTQFCMKIRLAVFDKLLDDRQRLEVYAMTHTRTPKKNRHCFRPVELTICQLLSAVGCVLQGKCSGIARAGNLRYFLSFLKIESTYFCASLI